MPYRAVVSSELAKLFGVLSHPIRVRIIEELQKEDLTVGTLKDILGVTHASVSQQLAILRSHHLVVEKRQGRHVYYHLRKPDLARWIMGGVAYISPDPGEIERMNSAIQSALTVWSPASNSESTEAESESGATKKRAKA